MCGSATLTRLAVASLRVGPGSLNDFRERERVVRPVPCDGRCCKLRSCRPQVEAGADRLIRDSYSEYGGAGPGSFKDRCQALAWGRPLGPIWWGSGWRQL